MIAGVAVPEKIFFFWGVVLGGGGGAYVIWSAWEDKYTAVIHVLEYILTFYRPSINLRDPQSQKDENLSDFSNKGSLLFSNFTFKYAFLW